MTVMGPTGPVSSAFWDAKFFELLGLIVSGTKLEEEVLALWVGMFPTPAQVGKADYWATNAHAPSRLPVASVRGFSNRQWLAFLSQVAFTQELTDVRANWRGAVPFGPRDELTLSRRMWVGDTGGAFDLADLSAAVQIADRLRRENDLPELASRESWAYGDLVRISKVAAAARARIGLNTALRNGTEFKAALDLGLYNPPSIGAWGTLVEVEGTQDGVLDLLRNNIKLIKDLSDARKNRDRGGDAEKSYQSARTKAASGIRRMDHETVALTNPAVQLALQEGYFHVLAEVSPNYSRDTGWLQWPGAANRRLQTYIRGRVAALENDLDARQVVDDYNRRHHFQDVDHPRRLTYRMLAEWRILAFRSWDLAERVARDWQVGAVRAFANLYDGPNLLADVMRPTNMRQRVEWLGTDVLMAARSIAMFELPVVGPVAPVLSVLATGVGSFLIWGVVAPSDSVDGFFHAVGAGLVAGLIFWLWSHSYLNSPRPERPLIVLLLATAIFGLGLYLISGHPMVGTPPVSYGHVDTAQEAFCRAYKNC